MNLQRFCQGENPDNFNLWFDRGEILSIYLNGKLRFHQGCVSAKKVVTNLLWEFKAVSLIWRKSTSFLFSCFWLLGL